MVKLGIIDIDGMFYHSARETIEESIQVFKEKFQNIIDATGITHYVAFYSKGKYFRHNIDPNYKIGRVGKPAPKFMKALKEWVIAEYGLQTMYDIEADDLCAYWMNKKEYDVSSIPELWGGLDKILCTPDKDLLESIPGKHFNYSYKLKDDVKALVKEDVMYQIQDEDVIKGWWIETTEIDAYKFKWIQVLMGDSSDGVQGIPKTGIVGATKIIDQATGAFSSTVLNKYIDHYQSESKAIFEFQKNYRLLHMLENDEDFIREVQKVPDFPTITEIIKEVKDEPKVEF